MSELKTEDAIKILLTERKNVYTKLTKAYNSYCLYPNEHDQQDYDDYNALCVAFDMAIEALRGWECGGVSELRTEMDWDDYSEPTCVGCEHIADFAGNYTECVLLHRFVDWYYWNSLAPNDCPKREKNRRVKNE